MEGLISKYSFDAVVFDLDGVVTQTARLHARAWKKAFDDYLHLRSKRDNEPFKEFVYEDDYLPYIDGRPRYQGVKCFLESREINIPFGNPSDEPHKETICGIGNAKNKNFREVLDKEGAEVYESTISLIKILREKGVRIGVASSSKNCRTILQYAGIEELFETRIDGEVSSKLGLKGKPEGDIFVTAAREMGAFPARSVVVEDAISGVKAGRNGGFGLVLGIARKNNIAKLLENGADVVVEDLSQITPEWIESWFHRKPEDLFKVWENTTEQQSGSPHINPRYTRSGKSAIFEKDKIVFFLDYDGTLTPIVSRPELAVISQEMKHTVERLGTKHQIAIVSGRMREDVQKLAGIEGIVYAGSHGFDIQGPGISMVEPAAEKTIPLVEEITEKLKQYVDKIDRLLIEEKKFSVAVHYRLVDESNIDEVKKIVDNVMKGRNELRVMSGKKVFEILPAIDWNKGKAIRWIIKTLDISWDDTSIIYIGDDVTDEDAFRVIRARGTGILVSDEPRESAADFQLSSPDEVKKLFMRIIELS